MPHHSKLPFSILLNNPGQLQSWPGIDYHPKTVLGMAEFRRPLDGLIAIASHIDDTYRVRGFRTLPTFQSHFCPAGSGNDLAYQADLARRLGRNRLTLDTAQLHLDRSWPAFDMIRAIIGMESGEPPSAWPTWPHWYSVKDIVKAMMKSGRWKKELSL